MEQSDNLHGGGQDTCRQLRLCVRPAGPSLPVERQPKSCKSLIYLFNKKKQIHLKLLQIAEEETYVKHVSQCLECGA